jgi:mRNA interferase HigB
MTVYGHQEVNKFNKNHASGRKPLSRFLDLVTAAKWNSLVDVKHSCPSVDYVPSSAVYVFNIGGNNFRLIASIDFAERIIVIQSIMTHANYNKERL